MSKYFKSVPLEEADAIICDVCKRKFYSSRLPQCEQNICPKCCALCLQGGCTE